MSRPEPLRGREEGTFAHHTVTVRMAGTVRRVLADNPGLPPGAAAALEALVADLPHGRLRPLADDAADAEAWAAHLAPHLGRSWLDVPWFVAETYFFRRILEAVGYFGARAGQDPFRPQKDLALATTLGAARALAERTAAVEAWSEAVGARLLRLALWGNQADLNLWPAGEDGGPRHATDAEGDAHLLVDDAPAVACHLADGAPGDVHLVADNAGLEFVTDLALVDVLLRTGTARTVHLHVKAHPTFVSDVVPDDVGRTLDGLGQAGGAPAALARRLADARADGRLDVSADPFWTSPLPGWAMPDALTAVLAEAALVLVKGDANYRRLLGDRHWPHTTPFAEVTAYAPAPLAALRTLKSEVVVGLAPGVGERTAARDPEWMVDGRWGVIQFNPARG